MKEVLSTINYQGKDYKIYFNLNVMEAIQSEYGTIEAWGSLTDGSSGETDIKALVFGFREMINEGIEIYNEDNNTNEPLMTHKKVARMLTEIGLNRVTKELNDLVIKSAGADESKNA